MPGKKVKANHPRMHSTSGMRSRWTTTTGDHTIFVGKILKLTQTWESFESGYDLKKARVLYHAGGNNFALLDPKLYKSL